jgi:hypothetical protein
VDQGRCDGTLLGLQAFLSHIRGARSRCLESRGGTIEQTLWSHLLSSGHTALSFGFGISLFADGSIFSSVTQSALNSPDDLTFDKSGNLSVAKSGSKGAPEGNLDQMRA